MKLRSTMILAVGLLAITVAFQSLGFLYLFYHVSLVNNATISDLTSLQRALPASKHSIVSAIIESHQDLLQSFDQTKIVIFGMLFVAFALASVALILIRYKVIGGVEKLYSRIQYIRKNGPGTVAEVWSNDEFSEILSAVNILSFSLGESSVNSQHLKDLIESLSEPILIISNDGVVQEANASVAQLVGKQSSEMLGHNLTSIITCDTPLPTTEISNSTFSKFQVKLLTNQKQMTLRCKKISARNQMLDQSTVVVFEAK